MTDYRRAIEQQLLQTAALNAAANAIVITDATGRILWVNPAFTRLTGYAAEEVIGRNPRILKSGQHDEPFYRLIWNTILAGRAWSGEVVNRRQDGTLYTEEMTITPVRRDGTPSHFVAIKQDITTRKQAEAEIHALNVDLDRRVQERTTQLEAANRELEAFSHSVSHDLRAPLRTIAGFSRLLVEDCRDQLDANGHHYLERVQAATVHMGALIDDLLSLSSVARATIQREVVDLSDLVGSIAIQLREAEPDRRVEFVIAPDLYASGDARLLELAMDNVLRNAWKYTSRHATARIEVGQMSVAEYVVQHPDAGMQNPQSAIVYFVRDDGAGFDMGYADKLFAAFQRLHCRSEFEGTGIGLTTVQRIIHRHGGRIWAEGAPERGATFYFTLGTEEMTTPSR